MEKMMQNEEKERVKLKEIESESLRTLVLEANLKKSEEKLA